MTPECIALSLGGSLIVRDQVQTEYLNDFALMMSEHLHESNQRCAIVTGGGSVSRFYQDAMRRHGVEDQLTLDTIGILPTHINAQVVAAALNQHGVPTQYLERIRPPERDAHYLAWTTGGNEPGQTSDGTLVDLAQIIGITKLFNATNVAGVYEFGSDGRPDFTKLIQTMTWKKYLDLMGERGHVSGESLPFGMTAARKCMELGFTVFILSGHDLINMADAFSGNLFIGTRIHP